MKRMISLILSLTLILTFMLVSPCPVHADSEQDEMLKSLLNMAMGDSFFGADTQLDVQNGNVILRIDLGIDESVVAAGKYDSDIRQSWKTLKENFTELCSSVLTLLDSMNIEGGSCSIFLTDDAHSLNADVYLCVINGIVMIDALA